MAILSWTSQILLLIPATVFAQIQCQRGAIGQRHLTDENAILARDNFLNLVGCTAGSTGSVTIAHGGGVVAGANGVVATFDQAGDSATTVSCADLDNAFDAVMHGCPNFGGSNAVGQFAVGIESDPVFKTLSELG